MTEPSVVITPVIDKEEMITYWPYIKDTDLCDNSDHAEILRECLAGRCLMSKGTYDGELVGVVVFSPRTNGVCFVHTLHLKNHVVAFRDLFFKVCRDAGYKKILATTTIPEETYTRLTKLKKIYSVYEYDLLEES